MSVRRIFVEKKPAYAVKAGELREELENYLGIHNVKNVRVLIRYDIENLSEETYKKALVTIFSEPPVDLVYEEEFTRNPGDLVFSVEYLPGQFDQRADSAEQCVKLLKEDEEPVIRSATTYVVTAPLTAEQEEAIKSFCINPVDSRQADEEKPETLVTEFEVPEDILYFDGFADSSEEELKALYGTLNLAMTFKDFLHIQNYYKKEEHRDPSVTEIRVLDTYWSDHCRHTTFSTELKNVSFTFNANARSLVTKKTNRIGIVFSDNFNAPDYRWFFNEIETYSTRAVENCGYDFLIQPNKNIHSQSNILRMVNGKMVDGLVIFSKTLTEAEYKFLSDADIPYVYVYFKPSFSADIPDHFFWDDNRKGGYWATKHLLEHGHRKILTIRSNDPELKMYDDRTAGYMEAMAEYGAEPAVLTARMDFESQKEFVRQNIEYIRKFTGIFSQQDLPALSIVQQLKKYYGMNVPEDISIVGYNDIELIHYLDIPLDTIADPREEVITNAVNSLVCRIEGREDLNPRKIYPRLITRGSVRDAAQAGPVK